MQQIRLKYLGFLLALLAFAPDCALADAPRFLPQDLTVRVWTAQQGLPDNSVTAVLQTRDGYLWVGTSGGLARFDGVRFVPMSWRVPRTNESLRVTALCEDSMGRLWIGTQGTGLLCYSDGAMTRFHATTNVLDDTINSIAEDSTGNLWLGTPSGLDLLEKTNLTRFTSTNGLPNDFVSNVHVARSGTVWITTRGGMCQFKNGKIDPIQFQTDSPGRSPESLGVYEDRLGNLWAFGDTYLVKLPPQSKAGQPYVTEGKQLNHFGSGDSIASLRIWSLCEGRHGELWIGTSGKGLYCFTDDKFLPVVLRNGGLTSDVRALCEDREGNLWLGTDGGGLVRLQPRNVRVLDASVGLPNLPPVCLAINSQGHAWVGFERGGVYAGNAERFDHLSGETALDFQNLVSSICVAPDSGLWIGTPGAGLYCVNNQRTVHFGTANGLSDDFILSTAIDESGGVWAGTLSGELNHIADGKISRFGPDSGLQGQPITAILCTHSNGVWIGSDDGTVFRVDGGKCSTVIGPAALGMKAIRALREDASGRIWLATAGGRFACVWAGAFLNWDLNPGVADDSIYGLLFDDDGDLWLETARSIYHVVKSEINASLSGQSSMRPQPVFEADASPNPPAIYGWPRSAKSPDGKLWFGMANGVVVLDPKRLVMDLAPLPALIESVTVNGYDQKNLLSKSDNPDSPARLSSAVNSLEIQFTSLNFSAPEKIRFRHRLENFDTEWVDDGTDRKVNYGRLPYGNYTFRVQAGNSDSWYANGAAFNFLIPSPLWRREWALALYGVAAVILIAGTARLAFNRRLRRRLAVLATQQAMERERMRIAQDMHDKIGSKLTKISFMSERAKGELVGHEPVANRLDSIAQTSRDLLQSLDEIVWAVNPHNDTLEHVAAYLGHYATEYLQNTAVECELTIPQGLPDHPLSAEARHNLFLAFEEALNNALKHGKASRIKVDMRNGSDEFNINIEDNGCGFDADALLSANNSSEAPPGQRGGNGLRNLHQRLALIGGEFKIRSVPGHGTTVSLTMPLKPSKAQTKRNKT